MAFGFPASYSEILELDTDPGVVREAISLTLDSMGWSYESPYPQLYLGKVPASGSSWGERLTIKIIEPGRIAVESKCAPFPQLFDWGKNRQNVRGFIDIFQAKAARLSTIGSLTNNRFNTIGSTPLERVLSDSGRSEELP